MTGENRRANIAQDLAKAERDLRSARLIMADGDHEGAVSRAYYSAFHCARALLLAEGLEAKSHSGVAHLVSQHYVRTGRLHPEDARILSRLEKDRQDADDDAAAVFTASMAEEAVEKAQRFGDAVRGILKALEYLGPPRDGL